MSLHSLYSPSAAERWLTCPGSLVIPSQDEEKPSIYAAEGTMAHMVASDSLLLGVNADYYRGITRTVDGFEITVTDEMVEAVQFYLDFLFERGLNAIEHRIIHSEIEGFGGTLDAVGNDEIFDFKYGVGVTVEAENNLQLGCYALLYCDHYRRPKYRGNPLTDIKVHIIQPRAASGERVKSWTAEADWLRDLEGRIRLLHTEKPTHLVAGDHCRWCPHKAYCPELYDLTKRTIEQDFDKTGADSALRASEILLNRKAILEYLDAVEQWAHDQLERGASIPGFKLVDTFGNRRYAVDEATVEKRCRAKGFGKKQIYETVLKSPAQLEKVVGAELVSSLVERPHKGTTVVPESDKRPAVQRASTVEEFAIALSTNNEELL